MERGLPDEDGALSVVWLRECGVPPSDGVAEKGLCCFVDEFQVIVYVEDSSFDGVDCTRLDVEYVDGKGFTCSPVGSDVCASEHVQHALVGLAAEEAAVVDLWSGRSLCLFLASMARCRNRGRQFFSSVGSESSVPSRRQICIQLSLSIGRYHLLVQFVSQLGLTSLEP